MRCGVASGCGEWCGVTWCGVERGRGGVGCGGRCASVSRGAMGCELG